MSKPRADRLKICDETIPPSRPAIDLGGDVSALRSRLGEVVHELTATRHALWQREAELAAGVLVAARSDEKPHLAERLQAVLKGGAEAIDCHAAALYLLDEGTRHLKLRSSWGLPPKKLIEPPRPLASAVADLEALLGHAVVLTDATLAESWNAPESFPAALCVPVASPTIPLGTLWFFARDSRDFSDRQTNFLAEIIAGRVAADLDREALLNDAAVSEPAKRLLRELESWRHDNAARMTPLVAGWKLSIVERAFGGEESTVCEVQSVGRHRIAALVATFNSTPLTGTLLATALRVAFTAHAARTVHADRLLQRLNLALCAAFPGNVDAGAAVLLIDARTGRYRFAGAGRESAAFRIGSGNAFTDVSADLPNSGALGQSADAVYSQSTGSIQVGQTATLGSAIRLRRDAILA